MNWPGAELIYDRLKIMPEEFVDTAYKICLSIAIKEEDTCWEQVLIELKNDSKMFAKRK